MHAVCPAHLTLLDLIILTVFCEEWYVVNICNVSRWPAVGPRWPKLFKSSNWFQPLSNFFSFRRSLALATLNNQSSLFVAF
jgi:hypothetical protein